MAKAKTLYFCQNCGVSSPKWQGKCPSCGEWNTLSEEDVKGNLRFRRDTNNAAKTVFLKRGEKQKVTDRHVAGLARIGLELKVRTFLQEKEGEEITEVRTQAAQ